MHLLCASLFFVVDLFRSCIAEHSLGHKPFGWCSNGSLRNSRLFFTSFFSSLENVKINLGGFYWPQNSSALLLASAAVTSTFGIKMLFSLSTASRADRMCDNFRAQLVVDLVSSVGHKLAAKLG